MRFAFFLGNTNTGFSISDTGIISVATTLDIETTQTYSLVVKATDQNVISPLSSTAHVTIQITGLCFHTVFGRFVDMGFTAVDPSIRLAREEGRGLP